MRFQRLCFALCLAACPLLAQLDTRGVISGTVTDAQGSLVPGANVTVSNTATNVGTPLVTNGRGYYEAPLLVAGDYQVSVEAPGFKKVVRSGLKLELSGQLSVNLQLEVGSVSEAVTVTAESPILDTNSVTTGRVVSGRELMDLPVMTNNSVMLARLAPGVQPQDTTQYLSQGMVGGSSGFTMPLGIGGASGNEWSIDGAPNNRGGGIGFTPYTDMISEYKVETSNFDASFGHAVGLNVSFASKSGTNKPHGTATYQYWNTLWNADPFFVKQNHYRQIAEARAAGDIARADYLATHPRRPGGHSNNYGATISGPVYIPKIFDGRNKLFAFFSVSQAWDRQPARPNEINYTVPTAANRQGDFSNLLLVDPVRYQVYDPLSVRTDPARPTHFIRTPFTGNILPKSRIVNPAYDFYTQRLPMPNNDPTNPRLEPTVNFLASGMPDNTNYKGYQSRVDYNLSNKHRFFFRWNWSLFYEDARDWTFATERGYHSWDEYRKSINGVVDWTYTLSPTTVVNVNVAANQWWNRMEHAKMATYKPSDLGLPTYVDDKCAATYFGCAAPRMLQDGYDDMTWPIESRPKNRSQSLKVNLTQIRGGHSIRAGIDFRQAYRTDPGGAGNSAGSFTFGNTYTRRDEDGNAPAGTLGLSWAAFMLGIPSSMQIDTNASYALMNPYYAWYAQDTWRITRNFTVTPGLRLEYEQGPTERYNRAVTYFNPTASVPIADAARAAYARNPLAEVPVNSFTMQGGSVYAGVNGAPRRLWGNELMFLPRLSAAWQFNEKMVLRGGYGSYFESINVQNVGANQFGYSRTTSTVLTNDFGQTWTVGDPANGISPLKDPFPVRADGTRFDVPYGNALGSNTYLGRNFGYTPNERKHNRVQRWRASVQRQLSANMVIEAAYWGQFGDRLGVTRNQRALPEQYWATGLTRSNAVAGENNRNIPNPFQLSNFASLQTSDPLLYQQMSTLNFFTSPTAQKNALLRGTPHMSGLSAPEYIGKARSHALEVNFERRFSKGFNLTASYTRSTGETFTTIVNEFDLAPRSYLPADTPRPHRFIATGIFEFPFGKGRAFVRDGILSHVIGGWQSAVTYEFQSGPPLGWGNIFYRGDFATLADDLTMGEKSLSRWFNTDLPFERVTANQPAAYHVRVFPQNLTSVRADGINVWNGNLRRDFQLWEGARLEMRLDVLNLQNRSQFSPPNTSPISTNFGVVTSQTSSVNRFLQIQGRIQF